MTTSQPAPSFLTLLQPQIDAARTRLRAGLLAHSSPAMQAILPEAAVLESLLFKGVGSQLERIITPTMVLELNVSRLRGGLHQTTTEARFAEFVARLADKRIAASIAAEYPELIRLAEQRLDTWVSTSLELVQRLAADWPELLRSLFNGESPGTLETLHFPQRTTKRGGRGVVVLRFSGGNSVVYKPRSLSAECRFQETLAWLHDRGFEPEFRPIKLINRPTHGWMEWIEAVDCTTPEEVARFYRRQGAYLALLYAFEATDLHMSNIIAAGEHPIIIDLEALFHPRGSGDASALDQALDELIDYSVLRPGILPEPETASDDDDQRFDMSALLGTGGQRTPYTVPTWVNKRTDAMRMEHRHKVTGGSKNRPTIAGEPANPLDFLDELDAGFAETYHLLTANRDDLLAEGGLMDRFEDIEIRVIRRSGWRYGAILDASYHPDLLRDLEARAEFIHRQLLKDSDGEPDLIRLLANEHLELLAGDTPLFTALAHSRDVSSTRGSVIADLVAASGLDTSRGRIAAMDDADLERQRWLIRASFAGAAQTSPAAPRSTGSTHGKPESDIAREALCAAREVSERLSHTAVRVGDEASWIGVEPDEHDLWSIEPLGTGPAHGLPGVTLFLSHLDSLSQDSSSARPAQPALATLLRYLEEDATEETDPDEPVGLFEGIGGQLYGLAHLPPDYRSPEVHRATAHLIEQSRFILSDPSAEEEAGLAYGIGGLLTGLLATHHIDPDSGALAVAQMAGGRLIGCLDAEPERTTAGAFDAFWNDSAGGIGPLLALAELTGTTRYRTAAESHLTSAIKSNSHDAGLWRAYLFARPWLQNSLLRDQMDSALTNYLLAAADNFVPCDHSLGYGDMGMVDLLIEATRVLENTDLTTRAQSYIADSLEHIRTTGPKTAVPLQVESPGLIAGLSGIGYGLLRIAVPTTTPMFPTLLPPRWSAAL